MFYVVLVYDGDIKCVGGVLMARITVYHYIILIDIVNLYIIDKC